MRRPPFIPRYIVGADPKAIVRLERLGKLKKKIDFIGTQTRDLPACRIVPQPTTMPRGLEEGKSGRKMERGR
jgi:hypothetical protein